MPNLNLRKLWRKRSVTISEKDPSYKVVYLGNVLTGWAKGEGCVDKPLSTLWRNYCQSSRNEIVMKITICGSGLNAVTREHGITEYWAHRITFCGYHPAYPKVFCWVYRHEGRRLKQELRCHAVLCHRNEKAVLMANQLKDRLILALHEFKREKVVRQNARLSLVSAIYDNASLPTRKVLLSTGSANYRPPLERSKSAPKLGSIEETVEEHEDFPPSIPEEESSDSYPEESNCLSRSQVQTNIILPLVTRSVSNSSDSCEAIFSENIIRTESKSCDDLDLVLPLSNVNNVVEAQNDAVIDNENQYLINVNTRKLSPGGSVIKTPVFKRKFIRSITIDHVFDDENKEVEDEKTITTRIIDSKNLRLIDITSYKDTGDDITPTGSTGEPVALSTTPHTVEDDSISMMRGLSLTRQLSLPTSNQALERPEEIESSLTSDHPESLGSHSCNSSCGGGDVTASNLTTPCLNGERINGGHNCEEGNRNFSCVNGDIIVEGADGNSSNMEERRSAFLDGVIRSVGRQGRRDGEEDEDEPDNISEESGYAEEKEMPAYHHATTITNLNKNSEPNELCELLSPT